MDITALHFEEPVLVKYKKEDGTYGIARVTKYPDDDCDSPRDWDGNIGKMVCWSSRHTLGDNHEYETPRHFLRSFFLETVMKAPHFGQPVISFIEDGLAKNVRFQDHDEDHPGCRVIEGRAEDDDEWVYVNDIAWPSDVSADRTWLASQCVDWLTMNEVRTIIKSMPDVLVLPLYIYEHSGVCLSTSPFNDPWDSGQVGYIYCTLEDAKKQWGIDPDQNTWKERAKAEMENEVEIYNTFLGGGCYRIAVENFAGDFSMLYKDCDPLFKDVEDGNCGGFFDGYDDDEAVNFIQEALGGDITDISDEEITAIRENYIQYVTSTQGNDADATQKREFFVDTPLGRLRVYAKTADDDPKNFPGVYIDLVGKDGKDGTTDSQMITCVEFESATQELQTCSWIVPGDEREPDALVTHEISVPDAD